MVELKDVRVLTDEEDGMWGLSETTRSAEVSDLVEALPGEVVDWCSNHRQIAWEHVIGEETVVVTGMRCTSGAWLEGAGTWDCVITKAAVVPLGEDA